VRANGYLIDDKFTDKHSFTITVKMWRKIEAEAARTGVRPRLRVSIAGLPKLCVMLEDDHIYEQGQLGR
jgi:hypothetical protein